MHPAKWLLRPLRFWMATPVGVSNKTITSARCHSRLPPTGKWRQSKTSSRKGSLLPRVRRAASPTGCPPSRTSRPLTPPASSTVARSRPIIPLGSVTGSPGLLREMASYLLRLPSRRLLGPRSRRSDQSEPYKASIQKSTELMSCSPAWPTISTADGNDSKK